MHRTVSWVLSVLAVPVAFLCGLSVSGMVVFAADRGTLQVIFRLTLLVVGCGVLLMLVLLKAPSTSPTMKRSRARAALIGGVLGLVLGWIPPLNQMLLSWLFELMGGRTSSFIF